MRLQANGNNQNPNLKILARTLENLLLEKGEDARGIIFVRTRATCYALASWFSSDEVSDILQQLHATAFTGAGAHEEEGGNKVHSLKCLCLAVSLVMYLSVWLPISMSNCLSLSLIACLYV